MKNSISSIGIIGAGKVGIVLAQLATKAGYAVYIAGSGEPSKIALTISVLVPGAVAMTSSQVARKADGIMLAIPLGKYTELPKVELDGKLVIDAMNYWWEVDGDRPEFTDPHVTTSELVQRYLSGSRVVKAFSHIGYHDLYDDMHLEVPHDRKAVAIAGDNAPDLESVSNIVHSFGFDTVTIGALSDSRPLQPGGPIFGANVKAATLQTMLRQSESHIKAARMED